MSGRAVERPSLGGREGRSVSIDGALAAIPDRARVFLSGGSAAPVAIDRAMAEQRHRWSAIELVSDRLVEAPATFAHPGQPFRALTMQPSAAVDGMRDAGALETRAVPFSRFGDLLAPAGPWPIDVAIVHVSRPGPEGRFSLGVSVATPLAAIAAAPLVIAQVNPRMPYTFGSGELDRDEIDLLVEVDHPLVETRRARPDATARRIGGLVASLVPDGATLQVGVGALADAVLQAVADRRDLAVHSGVVTDGIVDLFETGAVTGAGHPRFPGRMVSGLLGGSTRLFEFAHRNPALLTVSVDISHGPDLLRRLPRLRCVNSAVEVALDGSVNAEAIGPRIIGGPGGAPDYAAAATANPDGCFVVSLPATAARGTRSRIVERLDGVPTTVDGRQVGAVVTEHGVADLAGLEPAARAASLRAVADPRFAAELG